MKLAYTVSQDKYGRWYAHRVGFPKCPCTIGGKATFGSKSNALHNAALMMGLPYTEYMDLRRHGGKTC